MFCNDQFLRARKRLGVFVVLSKKPLGAGKVEGKKAKSPAETGETIVEKENEEEVEKKEETGERQEAPMIRKSKQIAKGKGKVIYPMNSKKKKDLPQLDEVTRKRRKLLDSSTAAAVKAKTNSPQLPWATPAKLMATSTTEVQPVPPPLKPIVEVAPPAVKETSTDMLEAQSLTFMI